MRDNDNLDFSDKFLVEYNKISNFLINENENENWNSFKNSNIRRCILDVKFIEKYFISDDNSSHFSKKDENILIDEFSLEK